MQFSRTVLPWSDRPVHRAGNLLEFFAERLPKPLRYHLPASITVCADLEVPVDQVTTFLDVAAAWLVEELARRENRSHRFVELGLFTDEDLRGALTRRHKQPWILYYSENGGLGDSEAAASLSAKTGVIPCSTMRNHAVGWQLDEHGRMHVWLVTARKEGEDWDWDSDLGHESAHAAFAPVPLFVQALGRDLDLVCFADAREPNEMTADQLARMCYLFTELAVVSVRGEARPTATGLPLGDPRELHAFLRLLSQAMPSAGFDRALKACDRVGGVIAVEDGSAIFEIGAAALRALAASIGFVNEPDIARVAAQIFPINRFSTMPGIC
jgi:hypothetical protein